jgi:hypothetical protein
MRAVGRVDSSGQLCGTMFRVARYVLSISDAHVQKGKCGLCLMIFV